MKKIFILFIILLSGIHVIFAQPYQSIFGNGDGDTKWVFIWHNLSISVNDTAFVEKDTVVNGISYKKIATIGKNYGGTGGWLMRENTDSGHVWFRSIKLRDPFLDDTTEVLAFRYDLNVGDTFDIGNSEFSSYPDSFNVVDSIKYIGGLKYIYFKGIYAPFKYNEPFTIIEGIGSNMGILWKHMSPTTMRQQYLLCSYKNSNKTSYVNKYHSGACWIHSDVKTGIERVHDISIYPQPAEKNIWIDNKTTNKITQIQILSQAGKLIKTVTAPEITHVEIEEIPAGYYFLKMCTSNGYIINKSIIVQ